MKLSKRLQLVILIFLSLLATSLLVWFLMDIRSLYKTGNLRPTRGFNRSYIQRQTFSPDQIEGWMTFSYINYVFNLPKNYLANSLSIQDKRYPNLEINQYAKDKKFNSNDFLKTVQTSVVEYAKPTL